MAHRVCHKEEWVHAMPKHSMYQATVDLLETSRSPLNHKTLYYITFLCKNSQKIYYCKHKSYNPPKQRKCAP